MKNFKILVVEDEKQLARLIELELKFEGYDIETAYDGKSGLERGLDESVDLILLDLMLPEMNGIEVCRKIRQHSDKPIIMLTAKDSTMDKVTGLDIGADDYITKPFEIEEVLARIRASLRRHYKSNDHNSILTAKEITLNKDKYSVCYNDEPIQLTKKEYELLKYIMENKGIVLTRGQILENVWGYNYFGDTNVVDVYIRYLRSKIDDIYNMKLIETVRGVGYTIKDD